MIYDDRLVSLIDKAIWQFQQRKKHRIATRRERETLSMWTCWTLMLLVLYISIVRNLLRWSVMCVFCVCVDLCTCECVPLQNRNEEKMVKAKRSYWLCSNIIIASWRQGNEEEESCERNYHRRNSRSGRNSLCRRITEQNEETYYIEYHTELFCLE